MNWQSRLPAGVDNDDLERLYDGEEREEPERCENCGEEKDACYCYLWDLNGEIITVKK